MSTNHKMNSFCNLSLGFTTKHGLIFFEHAVNHLLLFLFLYNERDHTEQDACTYHPEHNHGKHHVAVLARYLHVHPKESSYHATKIDDHREYIDNPLVVDDLIVAIQQLHCRALDRVVYDVPQFLYVLLDRIHLETVILYSVFD